MAKKLITLTLTLTCLFLTTTSFTPSPWSKANATFNEDLGYSMRACGYVNLDPLTTALSTDLFNNGTSCGQCYKIMCDHWTDPTPCNKGRSVTVTATDESIYLCPPNVIGGRCNPPRQQFRLSAQAWKRIGINSSDIIRVVYQRVPCVKQGGVTFTVDGSDYFYVVLISNVGGAGSIASVWIKGSETGWMAMSRSRGANWMCNAAYLSGQALSFTVTTTDGVTKVFNNAVPSGWSFGQAFSTNIQF